MHVIGTAGHVDHGKSSLVERLTGIDPDRFEEEKRRGLTIDLGFAWLTLPSGREIGIVDVPGHERFIRNMLAGAGGVSLCMFVVAANEGWMPQSAEHLVVVDMLGLRGGVVALTKADLVDGHQLERVREDVRHRVDGTVLDDAPVVACSATTGDGVDALLRALDEMVAGAPQPADIGRPRLWIDRVFTVAGAGTVVTGTLMGGSFHVGEEVEIQPHGVHARIRTIQTHKRRVESLGPGNRCALNLSGIDRTSIARGDAVVRPGGWRPSLRCDVRLRVASAPYLDRDVVVAGKGAYALHVGSAETPVRVRPLEGAELRPGEEGWLRLQLRDPLPLMRGDRFVLRDAGRVLTVAGGEVVDPHPSRTPPSLSALASLGAAQGDDAVRALVDIGGRLGRAEAYLRTDVAEVAWDGATLGGDLVSEAELTRLGAMLEETVAVFHSERPEEAAMPRETARLALGLEPAAFADLLAVSPTVVEEGAGVRLATHRRALAPEQERTRAELFEALERDGLNPPMIKELGADRSLLHALERAGDLVRVGDFYLTAQQARDVRARVRAAIAAEGPLTVAQIRDLLGTSRKYAVPLCEWLDATGATVRRGDVRLSGPKA